MADIAAGLGNLNTQIMNNASNKINLSSFNQSVTDYRNINNMDNFTIPSGGEDADLLRGTVTKIQEGQKLEEADFEGLSSENSEFARDLNSLVNRPGPGGVSGKELYGTQDVADKFSNLLDNYVNNVDSQKKQAEKAIETFATGGDIDMHSVMIASEKASLSMQLALQLRNKVVQAYQEIQRIRV